MRKLLLLIVGIVGVLLIVLGGLVVWIGSPKGPKLQEVAHLREPHLKVLPAQKVLVVTARGDPNTVGKKAFGLLMRTYFDLAGVPKSGPQFKPPRARWPVAPGAPPSDWMGTYAMPVPESITALPAKSQAEGLEVALATWDYGEVAEVLHVGPYTAEQPTIARLLTFIAEQGREIAGVHEEEYLRGPGMFLAGNPETYLTLIRYPVRVKAAATPVTR